MVRTRNSVSRDSRRRVLADSQIVIVITGMADEFPCAFRNDCGDGAEELFVERSGNLDAESAVGSAMPCRFARCRETWRQERARISHLCIARPKIGPRQQFARPQAAFAGRKDSGSRETPQAFAARNSGRSTAGNKCVCL